MNEATGPVSAGDRTCSAIKLHVIDQGVANKSLSAIHDFWFDPKTGALLERVRLD